MPSGGSINVISLAYIAALLLAIACLDKIVSVIAAPRDGSLHDRFHYPFSFSYYRSVPFTMKVPLSVMIGTSPK